MQKENRQKRSVSAGFWQGQKDLNPRHAVLEWMWKQRTRSGEGAVLPGSSRKSTKGRCCSGAIPGKTSPKHPEKQENHKIVPNKLTGFDKARIIKSAGDFPAGRLLQTGG